MKSRQFALLCGVGLFAFISYNLVRMPVLSLYAQSLGAGPEAIGFIVSASTLTGVFLKWPAGALSDIHDRRWLLLAGLLAFAIPPFFYQFVSDVGWLIALRFAHGMATAVFAPIALAVVADLCREARGAAYGSYTAATQAGAMLGPVLGGWLVVSSGFPSAFLTAGVLGTIAVLFFLLMRLPPQIPHAASGAGPAAVVREMARGARTVLGNVRVVVTSITDGARQVANGALMAFLDSAQAADPELVDRLEGLPSAAAAVSGRLTLLRRWAVLDPETAFDRPPDMLSCPDPGWIVPRRLDVDGRTLEVERQPPEQQARIPSDLLG